MFEEEIRSQYEVASETRDRIVLETLISAFSTVLITILCLITLPAAAISICSIVLSAILYFFCRREFNDAVISVFQKQPSNDTFNVAALLAGAIQSVAYLFLQPEKGSYFAPVIFFSITVSMAMKLIFVSEILRNLELAASRSVHMVEIGRVNLVKRFVEQVCTVNPIIRFPDLVGITYAEDPSEDRNKRFIPIVLIGSAVLPFLILPLHGAVAFFRCFAALFAASAAFTGEMTFVLPYLVVQYKLRKLGSILFGCHSLNQLKDIDTLLVRDVEMFPPKEIQVEKLKFASMNGIAKAVEYTASVLEDSNAPEAGAFRGFLGFRKELMHHPDALRTVSGYGSVATFGEDTVLVGNRSLLLSYDVTPYPQEKEAALSTGGSLLYCAINGELALSCLFSYRPDPVMKRSAEQIGGDFNLIVDTDDCCISENMVRKLYDMRNASIIVPDDGETGLIRRMRERLDAEDSPCMLSTKKAIGILESVRHAKGLFSVINACILTFQIGVATGILLTFLAMILFPSAVTALWIFAFHLLWTVPIVFLSLIRSKTAGNH